MQKYCADILRRNADGSASWFASWLGGPSLAKVTNCRIDIAGNARVTAYIQGEPDTCFSIPAKCWYRGCRVNGYVTYDDDGPLFRVCRAYVRPAKPA